VLNEFGHLDGKVKNGGVALFYYWSIPYLFQTIKYWWF